MKMRQELPAGYTHIQTQKGKVNPVSNERRKVKRLAPRSQAKRRIGKPSRRSCAQQQRLNLGRSPLVAIKIIRNRTKLRL